MYRGAAVRVIDEEGRASFEHVGLGMRLMLQAYCTGIQNPVEEEIEGPANSGDEVTVELTLGPAAPVVRGRLVDEEGHPLPSTVVRLGREERSSGSGTMTSFSSLRTDMDGRFEFPWPLEASHEGEHALEFTRPAGENWPPLSGRIDLSQGIHPGDNDLGDIVLPPIPRLASGMVMAENEKPLRGAKVVLLESPRRGVPRDVVSWQESREVETTTDSEGRFSLYGTSESDILALRATRSGYLPSEPIDLFEPTSDLVITLGRAGSIRGRVLLDENIPAHLLAVEALYAAPLTDSRSLPSDFVREVEFDRKAHFTIPECASGLWNLTIKLKATKETARQLDGVLVSNGIRATDPRLESIDLRGLLHTFTITVKDAQGKATEDTVVVLLSPDEEVPVVTWSEHHLDRYRIITLLPSVILRVGAPGYRTIEHPVVRSDEVVVLSPGIPVRMVLADRAVLPDGDVKLGASVEHVGASRKEHGTSVENEAIFGGNGEILLLLPEPGTYRLQLNLTRYSNWGWSSHRIDHDSIDFEVRESSGEQLVDIAPSKEAIQAALRTFRDP